MQCFFELAFFNKWLEAPSVFFSIESTFFLFLAHIRDTVEHNMSILKRGGVLGSLINQHQDVKSTTSMFLTHFVQSKNSHFFHKLTPN